MDSSEFREFGKAAIDLLADYIDNIRERDTIPNVERGYLINCLPEEAPEEPGDWKELLQDFKSLILPGINHWHSPKFHGFFPAGHSWPSIVGGLLGDGLGVIGLTWSASPACTELEVVTLNWLGKMMGLPESFLSCSEGPGGGVIMGSASESTFMCLVAAADKKIKEKLKSDPSLSAQEIRSRLVVYASDQSNSSVERAAALASITMRLLKSDTGCRLNRKTLKEAIDKDKSDGLIPFFASANTGTTATCAFDPLDEIGAVCEEEKIWLHVDAAYAGSAFICPEYRHLMKGIELVHSFSFNPHKWLLVNYDCSALWLQNSEDLVNAFNIQKIYLPDTKDSTKIPDYRHWQLPLGRRFRALKLWSVMKIYGAEGLRNHIRNHVDLANQFAELAMSDSRLIIEPEPVLGLVCFRLEGGNSVTKQLLDNILANRIIYLTAATYLDHIILRFAVCARTTTKDDIIFSWNVIKKEVDAIIPPEESIIAKMYSSLKQTDKTDQSCISYWNSENRAKYLLSD